MVPEERSTGPPRRTSGCAHHPDTGLDRPADLALKANVGTASLDAYTAKVTTTISLTRQLVGAAAGASSALGKGNVAAARDAGGGPRIGQVSSALSGAYSSQKMG